MVPWWSTFVWEREREEGRDDGDRNAVRFLPRPEEGTPAPVLGRAKKRSRVVLGSA